MFNDVKFNIFVSVSTKVCSDANKADTNRVCNTKKHEPTQHLYHDKSVSFMLINVITRRTCRYKLSYEMNSFHIPAL